MSKFALEDIAIVAAPVRSMHHLLIEYYQLDDVGQGYDLLQKTPEKIVATLGRHPNDLMTSYYMRTPSEIYVECGWGGKEVDDTTPPVEMTSVGSFWGHKGLFEDIGAPPSARSRIGWRRPQRSIRRRIVVLSPPGRVSPLSPTRSAGSRTSTASTPIAR